MPCRNPDRREALRFIRGIALSLVVAAAGCPAVTNSTEPLQVGIAWSFASDYNYLVAAVLADLDFRKHFNASLRARFGEPLLPIANLHPDNRPRLVLRELIGSEVVAAGAAQNLLVERRVNVVIGDFATGPSEAVGTYAGANCVPQVSLSIGETLGNRKRYPYTFRSGSAGSHVYSFYWKYIVHFGFRTAVLVYTNDAFGSVLNMVKDSAQHVGRGGAVVSLPIFGNPPWLTEDTQPLADKIRAFSTRLICIAARLDAIGPLHSLLIDNELVQPRYQVLTNAASSTTQNWHPRFIGWHIITAYLLDNADKARWYEMRAKMTRLDIENHLKEYGIDEWSPIGYIPAFMLSEESFKSPASDTAESFSISIYNAIHAAYLTFNNMLHQGKAVAEVRGPELKAALQLQNFSGLSTAVKFDSNQDSMARMKVLVVDRVDHVEVSGTMTYVAHVVFGVGGTEDHLLPDDHAPLLWPDGTWSKLPPDVYRSCPPGTFLASDGACRICAVGQISTTSDAIQCTKCDVGRISNEQRTVCLECGPGHIASERGLDACSPCPAGLYMDVSGAGECKFCPGGEFSNSTGSVECIPCTPPLTTLTIGSKDASSCICPEGTVRMPDSNCRQCGEGLHCAAGSEAANIPKSKLDPPPPEGAVYPKVRVGYYTTFAEPLSIYSCLEKSWCPGPLPESCAENSRGLACGGCTRGYFRDTTGLCLECDDILRTRGLAVSLPLLFIPFIILLTRDHSDVNRWYRSKYLGGPLAFITLFFIQTLATYSLISLIFVPQNAKSMTNAFTFFVDFRYILRPECAEFHEYQNNFYAGLTAPVYLAFITAFTYFLCRILACRYPVFLRKWYVMTSFYGACYSAFFLSIATLTVTLFSCYPHPNGRYSLRTASSIECYSKEWETLVWAGAFGIAVFVAGPFGCMVTLIWIAPSHYKSKVFRLATKFLFLKYRIGCAYWSIVVLVKGFLIAMTTVFFVTPVSQFMWIVVVLLVYVPCTTAVVPWRSVNISLCDTVSHSVLAFCYAMGGFFSSETAEERLYVARWCMAAAAIVFGLICVVGLRVLYMAFVQEFFPAGQHRQAERFAKDFSDSLELVVDNPDLLQRLYELLPDVDKIRLRSVQRIIDRECAKRLGPAVRTSLTNSGFLAQAVARGTSLFTTRNSEDGAFSYHFGDTEFIELKKKSITNRAGRSVQMAIAGSQEPSCMSLPVQDRSVGSSDVMKPAEVDDDDPSKESLDLSFGI